MDFLLDSIYVTNSISDISFYKVLISFGIALLIGVAVSLTYMKCGRPSHAFSISLVLLPTAVSAIILLVNGNLGMSIAVLGTFSLVRFRSAQGTAYDITAILVDTAAGIACGVGYVWLALIVAAILCVSMLVLYFTGFGRGISTEQDLRVVVPESMNYTGLFDDIFDEYTTRRHIKKAKTTAMGTLYELTYSIVLKRGADSRAMIDAIRVRNGNLPVTLTVIMPQGEAI